VSRSWLVCASLVAATLLGGCDRAPPPVAKSKGSPKATPEVEVKPAAPSVSSSSPRQEPEGGVPAAKDPTSSDESVAVARPKDAEPDPGAREQSGQEQDPPSRSNAEVAAPSEEPPKPERIAILTPGGPLLIDVTLTIDGRPFRESFEEQLKALMDAADADRDGSATWKELLDNEEYLEGEAGSAAMNARQKREAIEQYDLNDDGYVQRQEATAWLGRGAGRTAAPLRVRSSRSYVANARTHSRVWPFLDRDSNGQLSADEIAAAADALLRLDADDDQVLTLEELASLREQLTGQNQITAVSDAVRDAAIHLEPGYTIERLDYILPDLYSPRQSLGPESFPDLPRLFAQLDESGEEWLDRDELARLLTIEPHAKLRIDFHSDAATENAPAELKIEEVSEELTALETAAPNRAMLSLGATRLDVSVAGVVYGEEPTTAYGANRPNEIELMVHDQHDSVFDELDANGDGRLGTREMAEGSRRLARRDANGDGVVTADELPYSMTVSFSRGMGSGDQFFVPPKAPSLASSEAGPEWFRSADFNADGDVSRREFLGKPERFVELDLNDDGFIDAEEAIKADLQYPDRGGEASAEGAMPDAGNKGANEEATGSDESPEESSSLDQPAA
jgi:hypothetical protein